MCSAIFTRNIKTTGGFNSRAVLTPRRNVNRGVAKVAATCKVACKISNVAKGGGKIFSFVSRCVGRRRVEEVDDVTFNCCFLNETVCERSIGSKSGPDCKIDC